MSEPHSGVPQHTAVQPGDILAGKYRVERVLGSGGMGTVVAALHLDLDEIRAVKLMHPVQVENAQAVERFLREARATVRLRSEHIPRLYDVGRLESGAPYIVMEVLEGSDLRTIIKTRGVLPIQEAVLYVLQTCEAVAEAHAAGIIHRDLKPANLFLTARPDGTPCIKVLDFGISKLLEPGPGADMTKTLDVLGSIHYMAPEQLRSSRSVDARADIWSLGVILYRFITGRLPFHGDTPVAYILSLRENFHPPSAFRSDLPPGLGNVVMRCLEKDPEKRIPTVKALMSELVPYTLGSSLAAPSPAEARLAQAAASRSGTAGKPVEINTLESWSVTQPMSESSSQVGSFLKGGTEPIPLAMRGPGGKKIFPEPETPAPHAQPGGAQPGQGSVITNESALWAIPLVPDASGAAQQPTQGSAITNESALWAIPLVPDASGAAQQPTQGSAITNESALWAIPLKPDAGGAAQQPTQGSAITNESALWAIPLRPDAGGGDRPSSSSGYYNSSAAPGGYTQEDTDSFSGTSTPGMYSQSAPPGYYTPGAPDSGGAGTLASSTGYYGDTAADPRAPSGVPSAPGSYPEAEATGPLPSSDQYDAPPPSGVTDDTATVPEYYSGPPPLQTTPIKKPGQGGEQETVTVSAAPAKAARKPGSKSKSLFSLPVFVLLGCAVGGLAGVIVAITVVNVRFGQQPPAPAVTGPPVVAPSPTPSPTPSPAPSPDPAPSASEVAPAPTAIEIELPDPDDAPTTPPPVAATNPPGTPTAPPVSPPRPPSTQRRPPPPKPTATAAAPPEPPRPGPIFE